MSYYGYKARGVMAKRSLIILLFSSFLYGTLCATKIFGQDAFNVEDLPTGKEVTIPRPATTLVPLNARITLAATDFPQTVQFKPINTNNSPIQSINLAIYDRKQERVQYIELKPNLPFLYSFKSLSSILIIPEISEKLTKKNGSSAHAFRGLKLQVESDKPLSIKR